MREGPVTVKSPPRRWWVLGVAFVTVCVVTVIGVFFWFQPIAEPDQAGSPLVSAPLNLAAYAALAVLLYDWAVRQTEGLFATAFIIGASQYILVLDLTLRGDRGLATAGASAVLILVMWVSVASVYSSFFRGRSRAAD